MPFPENIADFARRIQRKRNNDVAEQIFPDDGRKTDGKDHKGKWGKHKPPELLNNDDLSNTHKVVYSSKKKGA